LLNDRVYEPFSAPQLSHPCFAKTFALSCLSILAALSVAAPQMAHSQEKETVAETQASAEVPSPIGAHDAAGPRARPAYNWFKRPVESELIAEGEGSFGHYHIFAYTWWSELYTGGIEYERHSWGYFLGAREDYVAEALPVALLREPTKTDYFGDPLTQARQLVPGLALSPVGLRLMWRSKKSIKPYFIAKGGMIVFDQKALAYSASYQNFLLQIGIGIQARLTHRFDVRAGYSDIHFSNAFMVPSNPGLDVMSYNGGLVYRLGKNRP